MPSLIQKHAHVKGQRSNHHIFKFQPNPSWAKKRPNRYTSFQRLIKTKNKDFSGLKFSDVELILLINVKIPTVVGILMLISKIDFMFN